MIGYIAVGCLLLILLLGGSQLKAMGRFFGRAASGTWRPGAAMLALASFLLSAGLGARQAWIPSAAVFVIGLLVSMGARRAPRINPEARPPSPPQRGMGQEEARSILGVSEGASEAEIQAAYLRLIRMAHPDQGGTSGLAAQLNAARDALSGKK